MATAVHEQLNLLDLIDQAIESAELDQAIESADLRDDLVHRRDLPLERIGGCERLLFRLVREGLPAKALRGAAGLVLLLEQEALDQREDKQ